MQRHHLELCSARLRGADEDVSSGHGPSGTVLTIVRAPQPSLVLQSGESRLGAPSKAPDEKTCSANERRRNLGAEIGANQIGNALVIGRCGEGSPCFVEFLDSGRRRSARVSVSGFL